jgi:hypothetical protein
MPYGTNDHCGSRTAQVAEDDRDHFSWSPWILIALSLTVYLLTAAVFAPCVAMNFRELHLMEPLISEAFLDVTLIPKSSICVLAVVSGMTLAVAIRRRTVLSTRLNLPIVSVLLIFLAAGVLALAMPLYARIP